MSNTGENAELIARASEIAREGLICRSCGHVGAATGECCDHPDYDGASREQVADAITGLFVSALAAADARIAELDAALLHANTSWGYHDKRANDAEQKLAEHRQRSSEEMCNLRKDIVAGNKVLKTAEAERDSARAAALAYKAWDFPADIQNLTVRAETAETLLEETRNALAPFIRLADNVFSDGKNATVADEVTLWCFNDTDITFGDLRRARATLDRIGK